MWKYFIMLLCIVIVVMVIGFVRDNHTHRMSSPLRSELQLAANFGEIRPDHFHMGLDIRTGGEENQPVYSVEDGYISRVKIEPGGYGKAIFVTHTNGLTSLYAHLNRYAGKIEEYITARQYKTKSWQQDVSFSPGQYPVRKDELIAYSGNTGHSEGPHVHFELRDTKTGNHLNPALYGFEVRDNTPPEIVGLYWYDRRYSTYENDPFAIDIVGSKGEYKSRRKTVKVTSPLISLGIHADDKVEGSRFRYGVYRTQLWMDEQLIHDVTMDNFSDTDTRYVNACIDYRANISRGHHIQHLSRLPGNGLPIYSKHDGLISLPDNAPHQIHIRVTDVAGNASDLRFVLQKGSTDVVARSKMKNASWLSPGKASVVKGKSFVVRFSERAFYDSVPFEWKEEITHEHFAVSPRIHLHNPTVPVHDRYTVSVKSILPDGSPLRSKTVMLCKGFRRKAVVKGVWEGNSMRGSFDELGKIQLLIDTIPPKIEPGGWSSGAVFERDKRSVSVLVHDNLGEVSATEAELDGNWVPLLQKGNVFTYLFNKNLRPGNHRLMVTASDVAGNKISREFLFTTK